MERYCMQFQNLFYSTLPILRNNGKETGFTSFQRRSRLLIKSLPGLKTDPLTCESLIKISIDELFVWDQPI